MKSVTRVTLLLFLTIISLYSNECIEINKNVENFFHPISNGKKNFTLTKKLILDTICKNAKDAIEIVDLKNIRTKEQRHLKALLKRKDQFKYSVYFIMGKDNDLEFLNSATIEDTNTGLIWQNTIADKFETKFPNRYSFGNYTYAEKYCSKLNIENINNWRLPNIYEMTTLIDNKNDKEYKHIKSDSGVLENYAYSYITNTKSLYKKYAYNKFYMKVSFDEGKNNIVTKKSENSWIMCVSGKKINLKDLKKLYKDNKLKISQNNINAIDPAFIAQEEADEKERLRQLSIFKYNFGNHVSYRGFSNGSGWDGVIEDKKDGYYKVMLTDVTINGMYIQINATECTGNVPLKTSERHKQFDKKTRIWIPKYCIE